MKVKPAKVMKRAKIKNRLEQLQTPFNAEAWYATLSGPKGSGKGRDIGFIENYSELVTALARFAAEHKVPQVTVWLGSNIMMSRGDEEKYVFTVEVKISQVDSKNEA